MALPLGALTGRLKTERAAPQLQKWPQSYTTPQFQALGRGAAPEAVGVGLKSIRPTRRRGARGAPARLKASPATPHFKKCHKSLFYLILCPHREPPFRRSRTRMRIGRGVSFVCTCFLGGRNFGKITRVSKIHAVQHQAASKGPRRHPDSNQIALNACVVGHTAFHVPVPMHSPHGSTFKGCRRAAAGAFVLR